MIRKWYGVNKVGNLKIVEAVRETNSYIILENGNRYKKKSNMWNYDPFYFNFYNKKEAVKLLEQMKKASNLIFDTSLEELKND